MNNKNTNLLNHKINLSMLKHHDREKIIWDSHLTPNEKLTTLALNSFVDGNGECWPGQELLARMTGFTDRTIRNICTTLEEKLIITRSHRQRKDGSRTSDKYRINFDAIASIQPEIVSARKEKRSKRKASKALVQPENISARLEIQPENGDIPTGNPFRLGKTQGDRQDVLVEGVSPSFEEKIQPETVSGDLSSINLTIQKELSRDVVLASATLPADDSTSEVVESSEESEAANGSAKSRRKKKRKSRRRSASIVYEELEGYQPEKFNNFWIWYRKKICGRYETESRAGDRSMAADAWMAMFDDGVDYQEFREGCIAWAKSLEKNPVGIPNADKFLMGSEKHPTPYWMQDASDGNPDEFISDSDRPGMNQATALILAELKRLEKPAVLPAVWQEKTGCQMVSELTASQSQEFLNYLRTLEVPV